MYYVAEGVRLYSQTSWKMIGGDHGKDLIEENIDTTVDYYVAQADADNHAVREAACACIAELGAKVCISYHIIHTCSVPFIGCGCWLVGWLVGWLIFLSQFRLRRRRWRNTLKCCLTH